MFSKEEESKIIQRGSRPEQIQLQINRFLSGFPYANIVAPATIDKGILHFSHEEKKDIAAFFDAHKSAFNIGRFIPASGAATRMFKSLFTLYDDIQNMTKDDQYAYIKRDPDLLAFFNNLKLYPFYSDLHISHATPPSEIISKLLSEKGLNYGKLPKALLKFHTYPDECRTAFEEQLHEAVKLILPGKKVKIDFTVSEEHLIKFKTLEKEVVPGIEEKYHVELQLRYSFQKKGTDTIAVDQKNSPFKDENGELVFRPGGHGALLENLDDLDYGIVFINNIDNVSPEKNSELRIFNKKVLGGTLLNARIKAHQLMNELDSGTRNAPEKAIKWLEKFANIQVQEDFHTWAESKKHAWITHKLDRPIRVCGMVKNEGEPGGGPYFIKNKKGEVSLQIVEASQVDLENPQQKSLFLQSTHFNPVDIVCSVQRPDGSAYSLSDFVDQDTGFISEKSLKGRTLKALELPGLWNGSMSDWITIFVEIPAETFTPVKTIFDLIRPSHIN